MPSQWSARHQTDLIIEYVPVLIFVIIVFLWVLNSVARHGGDKKIQRKRVVPREKEQGTEEVLLAAVVAGGLLWRVCVTTRFVLWFPPNDFPSKIVRHYFWIFYAVLSFFFLFAFKSSLVYVHQRPHLILIHHIFFLSCHNFFKVTLLKICHFLVNW